MTNHKFLTEEGIKSGLARAFVSHPFDCLRISMQSAKTFTTNTNAAYHLYKTQGILGFYRGIIPFAGGNTILLSAYMNTYNNTKGLYGDFLAGSLGGLYGSPISTSIEYYRARYFGNNKKLCLSIIPKTLPITSLRDAIGWGAFFATFAKAKEIFKDVPQPFQAITVGSVSGLALWTSMYPIDTIKTRLQTGLNKNIVEAVQACYREGGIRKFWAGYSSCLLRAIPVNTAVVYFMK